MKRLKRYCRRVSPILQLIPQTFIYKRLLYTNTFTLTHVSVFEIGLAN